MYMFIFPRSILILRDFSLTHNLSYDQKIPENLINIYLLTLDDFTAAPKKKTARQSGGEKGCVIKTLFGAKAFTLLTYFSNNKQLPLP